MLTIEYIGNSAPDTYGVRLEHLFTYRVGFDLPPELIGPAPDGVRINFYLTGGELEGPRLRGTIRPLGADWLLVRPDGVGLLDMRMTLEANDGALIFATYQGVLDHGPDGFRNALSGSLLPNGTPFQTAPRLHTAHPDYLWLNRLQCVGIGKMFPEHGEARCDVYAVR